MISTRVIRNLAFPNRLYAELRSLTSREATTNRQVITAAVTKHLAKLVATLTELGFANTPEGRHLIRTSMDRSTLAALDEAAGKLGLNAAILLYAVLRTELELRAKSLPRSVALKKKQGKPPAKPSKKAPATLTRTSSRATRQVRRKASGS